MKTYFIQLKTESNQFLLEEVSEEVFKNRQWAKSDDGKSPRYVYDNFLIVDGAEIHQLSFKECPVSVLGWFCRAFSISVPQNRIEGGFIQKPAYIKFQNRKRNWLVETETGQVFKLKGAA